MKNNHLLKGFICFVIAIFIVSPFFAFIFPLYASEESMNCELALKQFLEAPETFIPTYGLKITIADNTITASKLYDFVYSTASFETDGTYSIETGIQLIPALLFSTIGFSILVFSVSVSLNLLVSCFIFLCKKLFNWLNNFIHFIRKKISKVLDYFHRKQLQKSLEEYDNPEYQRIYNIGYTKGYTDCLTEQGFDQVDPNI